MEKVCVLGLGYIGLPTAAIFATHGLQVTGVDVNDRIIATLKNGGLHIQEPDLAELVGQALGSERLCVSTQVEPADAFIIAVPTPFNSDKTADLRAVVSAAEAVVPHLQPGNLVVLESTSPPRTTVDLVAPILGRSGYQPGEDFYLAYSPERVLPGQILRELVENARVIGGVNSASARAGRDLYKTFVRGEIVLTDATTAEMVKLMENTYRDINIAIANEFSRLAERFGINVWDAIRIANRHPRVKILRPGTGVGGHCISVDPWFLVEAAPDLANLIKAARQVNDSQPEFVLGLCRHALGELTGRRIAALGLSYKPDVDDIRESPAIEVAAKLAQAGALVTTYEPHRPQTIVPGCLPAASLEDALVGAEAILLLVDHADFRKLDPAELKLQMSGCVAVDACQGWDEDAWRAAGFRYFLLGSNH